MGINSESTVEANLQIGPTDQGMVRLYIEGNGVELPMDFDPDEALEIAEELTAAAERARVKVYYNVARRENGLALDPRVPKVE